MSTTQLEELLQEAQSAREEKAYDDALAHYEELLASTDDDAPLSEEVRDLRLTALREQSRLYELLGDRDVALAGYEQYYLEAGSTQHAVEALVCIGELHGEVGRHQQALEAYDEALDLAKAFNYTAGRARALLGVGLTMHRLGRSEEALANLRKSQGLFKQVDDVLGRSRSWNHMGIVHVQLGQIDRAIRAFQEGLDLARQIGDRETAIALSNLGECHQLLYNMEQALEYHREALALAESTQFRTVEADLCRNLGYDLYNLGEVEEGVHYLERALRIAAESMEQDPELQALYTLALAEIRRGNAGRAREYAERLQETAVDQNYRVYQADALHALGLVHQMEGDVARAEQRWQEAVFLAHDTGRLFLLWQLHALLAEIASNPGLAGVHNQIAADIVNQIAYPIEDQQIRDAFLSAPDVKAVLEKV